MLDYQVTNKIDKNKNTDNSFNLIEYIFWSHIRFYENVATVCCHGPILHKYSKIDTESIKYNVI